MAFLDDLRAVLLDPVTEFFDGIGEFQGSAFQDRFLRVPDEGSGGFGGFAFDAFGQFDCRDVDQGFRSLDCDDCDGIGLGLGCCCHDMAPFVEVVG